MLGGGYYEASKEEANNVWGKMKTDLILRVKFKEEGIFEDGRH
jgi:hypothetical protein